MRPSLREPRRGLVQIQLGVAKSSPFGLRLFWFGFFCKLLFGLGFRGLGLGLRGFNVRFFLNALFNVGFSV